MRQKSTDCDDVRSCQSAEYTPVQLVYLLDVFGCRWHTRQANRGGSEATQSNQDLLQEKLQRLELQGDHRSSSA